MSERTELQNMIGAVLAISASRPATYDAAGYGATGMVYTDIGEVENHGNHGVTRQISRFVSTNTGIVKKIPGSKDYGNKQVMIGNLPSDAGQAIVEAASESQNHYSVKATYPLGEGEATPEIRYFDVIVSEYQLQDGSAEDIRKISCNLEICRKPVVIDAT